MSSNSQVRTVNGIAPISVLTVCVSIAGLLASPNSLIAQRGGGGGGGRGGDGGFSRSAGKSSETKDEKSADQEANKTRCAGIEGKHLLLERMTDDYDLTCDQQVRIEPLLHNEESVSKPLLAYTALTPEEKQALMLKIKLAARAQVRPLLTPGQQKKSDAEVATLADSGNKPKKGGKKGATPKKVAAQDDGFKGEEDLSNAIAAYTAFSVRERQQLILQVKQASRRDGAPVLTADQISKIDADIKVLQQQLL
jgi:hypothetical protein